MKVNSNLEAKKAVVAEIADKLKRATSLVLLDNKGLSAKEDTDLRAAFRASNVEYKVYKNRMLLRAFNQVGINGFEQHFEGSTAIAIGYDDVIAPAKIAVESGEKFKKLPVKAGYADSKLMTDVEVKALAKIPSKEILLSQLLGLLTNPMRSLAVVLSMTAEKNAQA